MSSAPTPASETDRWTVQRILEWTAGFLKQKGVESPRLEAELLLAFARKCPRIRLYTDFTEPLSDEQRAVMRELVQRRAKREPLAYLVGTREFYGRSFEVGPGVLIPRPETETLIDVCLERIPSDTASHVVEVGFGSGCISITLARQRPQCHVTATDISSTAVSIASRNVDRHAVKDRVVLMQGDCLEPLLNSGMRFEGLVSNPPYIREDERDSLQPEVAVHEPAEALFAGTDGLDVVRRLIQQAPGILKPGAFLAMELDPSQCAEVTALVSAAGFTAARVHRDLAGLDRIVEATFQG
jgi:release factor glutamine methyltransferase